LLALAYDLDQAIKPRTQPQFLEPVPPEPPDADFCAALTTAATPKLLNGRAHPSRITWVQESRSFSDRNECVVEKVICQK
jgi:hypothetical protein